MPLAAIENLASLDAQDAERKRREELARLQVEEDALADKATREKVAAKAGPAGLLQDLMGRGHPAVGGDVLKNASEDEFLNAQAQRRLGRQADALTVRKSQLSIPPPSATERYASMTAPLGRFATEDPAAAANELRTDPRGRLAALEQVKNQIAGTGDVSRETPGATPERDYYREEPSGTLSFTNRPEVAAEPGYRRYNSDSGATKDLGAPGGGLTVVGSGAPDKTPQRALLQDLDSQIGAAKRQRLTPQEMAQDLTTQQPGWDVQASRSSPGDVADQLLEAIGAGRLRPETGQYLQKRYAGYGTAAIDKTTGDFDPQLWQEMLRQGRAPGPGEAEARVKTGGQQLAEAAQQQQIAVQSALQPPQDGPGSTQSPALAAESSGTGEGLLAGLMGATRRGAGEARVGGVPAPETPPGLAAGAARVGVPLAAAALTGGASLPVTALASGGGAAAGELLGELFGGEGVSGRRIGTAGLGGAALGAGGALAGRVLGRGLGAVRSLSRRLGSDIPSIYTEGTIGAPTRVLGGLTEEAGAPGAIGPTGLRSSTLARARMGSADLGSTPIPEGPVPYLRENLPALRGGGDFTLGDARVPDEVMSIEDLIDQYLRQTRRGLPAPPNAPETLPALRGGGFSLR